MTTKEENTIIHKVYLTLENINQGTIKQIAESCGMNTLQVTTAIDRLLELRKAYVHGWDHAETARCPVRVIRLGRGENAPRQRKADLKERDTSQIDINLKMAEYRRFMKTFKPHPDYAAAWLFHQPTVELLGARYE